MTAVLDTTAPWQTAINSAGATNKQSAAESTQDRFLKLLVTQMKNQDPLNPMDNAQVTSQMAQLSTVSGIEKLNTTLEALATGMMSSQAANATALIGHGVLVPGSEMTLAGGQAPFGIELAQPADKVVVTIQDAAGKALQSIDLGAMGAGVHPLVWDGTLESGERAPEGIYRYTVAAQTAGVTTNVSTLRYATVHGVTPGAQGATLQLDRIGAVPFNEVRQVY